MWLYIADDIKVWFLCRLGLFRTNFFHYFINLTYLSIYFVLFCYSIKTCFEREDQDCIFHINYITEYCKSIINPVVLFIICQELKSRIWSSTQVRKMCASTINYLNLLGYFMLENKQQHSEWCQFYQIIFFVFKFK